MKKVIVEDDRQKFPCVGCGEVLGFQWLPTWHLSDRSFVVTCPSCKETMEVGGENAKLVTV